MANSIRPIRFEVRAAIPGPPAAIMNGITDLARWREFTGFAFLPGIEKAEFERQTEGWLGTRIRVRSTDGSTHTEEILAWEPERRVLMRLDSFSPPLGRLASHFTEEWHFHTVGTVTLVTREFAFHPRSAAAAPFLWLLSRLFRKAIKNHLEQIRRTFT